MSYTDEFFEDLIPGAKTSAEHVVPLVANTIKPKSVLDVGCGAGSWLKVWKSFAPETFGVDGSWVKEEWLQIPKNEFQKIDLEKTFDLKRKFDLVVTLEVAEHITEKAKNSFIDSLVNHSDTILFSAAIPWQGGTDHFNEQWPSYWIEAFGKRGYVFLDPFRHQIWNNDSIKVHYRQNLILFVRESLIENNDFFKQEKKNVERSLVNVVHPEKLAQLRDPDRRSLKKELPYIATLFKNFILNLVRLKK